MGRWKVLLLLPWRAECEQRIVYPDGITFRAPAEQEDWVRAWVEKRTGFPSNFDIRFYPGMGCTPIPVCRHVMLRRTAWQRPHTTCTVLGLSLRQ